MTFIQNSINHFPIEAKRERQPAASSHTSGVGEGGGGEGGGEEDSQSEHKVTAAERRKNDSAQIVDLSF